MRHSYATVQFMYILMNFCLMNYILNNINIHQSVEENMLCICVYLNLYEYLHALFHKSSIYKLSFVKLK